MKALVFMFKDRKVWKIFLIYFLLSFLTTLQNFSVNPLLLWLAVIVYLFFYICLYGWMLKCISAVNIYPDNVILPEYNIKKDFWEGLKLAFGAFLYLLIIFICLILLPHINSYNIILGLVLLFIISFFIPAQIRLIANGNIFQLFNYKKIVTWIAKTPVRYILHCLGLLLFNVLISVITSKVLWNELSLMVQTILAPYTALVSAYLIAKSLR